MFMHPTVLNQKLENWEIRGEKKTAKTWVQNYMPHTTRPFPYFYI